MDTPSANDFVVFLTITDPRLDRRKLHKLFDVLVIAICAVLCNIDNWEHIAEFGRVNEDWFKGFLAIPNGIPSPDTFIRVFTLIDPEEFEKNFVCWMQQLYQISEGEVIAIDGKAVRGTYNRELRKTGLHLVSAFAAQNGLVLGQVATDIKSNEITAIPKLLEMLKLDGCIVTLDAMGCQKKIVHKIREKNADYVISLKGNQGQLHEDVKLFIDTEYDKANSETEHDMCETIEKGHGRIETRRFWITDKIEWLEDKDQWSGLNSIGVVESIREISGTETKERRYYINSISANAKQFAVATREHWAIENKMHWVLDVTFDEDGNQTKNPRSAHNLAIMRRMALNTIRQDKSKGSLKMKMLKAGWNKKFLVKLLESFFGF